MRSETKVQYRALMLREDARVELEKAMFMFSKINGYKPTYSSFVTRLVHEYMIKNAQKAEES
jgi:hypothetical protein